MYWNVIAILVLDAILAVFVWAIIEIVWNNIFREELKVRSDLVWACLLGISVAIANAVPIAGLMLTRGKPTYWSFVLTLLLNAILALLTWVLIEDVWNNVVRKELKVRSNLVRARLLGIAVAIANAVAIVYLLL